MFGLLTVQKLIPLSTPIFLPFFNINMKIKVFGYYVFLKNKVIYFSKNCSSLIEYNFLDSSEILFNLPIQFERLKKLQNGDLIVYNYEVAVSYSPEFIQKKIYRIGNQYNSSFFKSKSFFNPVFTIGETDQKLNVILDEETRQFTTLPISEDIKFYEFHDEYFIPVTYMNAAQGHSYGPELSVYNYQGELIWSKDFREPDTYIDSVPVFDETGSVNISNVKFWNDKLLVSVNTQHLFCFEVHTGRQLWSQSDFIYNTVHLVALDIDQNSGFINGHQHFFKIDLNSGTILNKVSRKDWSDYKIHYGTTSFTENSEGLWTASMYNGLVACINKDTLAIDKAYHLESHGTINGSAAPHVTDEFIVIPDGLGNLEIIKRN
jgi:hypothetical protein